MPLKFRSSLSGTMSFWMYLLIAGNFMFIYMFIYVLVLCNCDNKINQIKNNMVDIISLVCENFTFQFELQDI